MAYVEVVSDGVIVESGKIEGGKCPFCGGNLKLVSSWPSVDIFRCKACNEVFFAYRKKVFCVNCIYYKDVCGICGYCTERDEEVEPDDEICEFFEEVT